MPALSSNLTDEALAPRPPEFGDGAFKEVI
jgi:hypothetical protein